MRQDFSPNACTHWRGISVVVAASSMSRGCRVSMTWALAGTAVGGDSGGVWNSSHICGVRRPSANCDISGTTRSPSHSSSVQRSTWQIWAILSVTRLSSVRESSVELSSSATSSNARVSVRRRDVSE